MNTWPKERIENRITLLTRRSHVTQDDTRRIALKDEVDQLLEIHYARWGPGAKTPANQG